jgi:hypothetical protein
MSFYHVWKSHRLPGLRTFGIAVINGGTAGLFWNYIIAAIGLGFVYSSIAELASM